MNKQIDIITDLLIYFDEMGFCPTTSCPDPNAYAIEWRNKMTNALKGYRTEIAREIFAEIERLMLDGAIGGKYPAKVINSDKFAELRKKYESEGADDV
jgi:hypothetical protein